MVLKHAALNATLSCEQFCQVVAVGQRCRGAPEECEDVGGQESLPEAAIGRHHHPEMLPGLQGQTGLL